MTWFFALFTFLISHGSYVESCTVEAELLHIFKKNKKVEALNIKIKSTKQVSGSHGDQRCLALKDQTRKITPSGERAELNTGETYTFRYVYTDSLGPEGINVTETWSWHQ